MQNDLALKRRLTSVLLDNSVLKLKPNSSSLDSSHNLLDNSHLKSDNVNIIDSSGVRVNDRESSHIDSVGIRVEYR